MQVRKKEPLGELPALPRGNKIETNINEGKHSTGRFADHGGSINVEVTPSTKQQPQTEGRFMRRTEQETVRWQGKIWFDPETEKYWRAGTDGSWIAVNERSIERHLRVNYGCSAQKLGPTTSAVEKALDAIQMSHVLDDVRYLTGPMLTEELKRHVNSVVTINGRKTLLLARREQGGK
jgi:hypothetical protein